MTSVQTITLLRDMRQACTELRQRGLLGLVPTMGSLHEGHLSLVRAARQRCSAVVASIFVNPLQFGPNEDFARYPRKLDQDLALLEKEGVDLVFAPDAKEMYPRPANSAFVDPGEMGSRLDGKARPDHFRGVTTVVTKLFHIIGPDLAFFGQKDAAQVAVLKRMALDLDFAVELVVCPTVREADGLAMSSRNQYLDLRQRQQALVLVRALQSGAKAHRQGVRDADELQRVMHRSLAAEPGVTVEYAEVVDPDTLLPLGVISGSALLAVAAQVGNTRLIDNELLECR